MSDLYHDTILDHYKYPRHYGALPAPDVVVKDENPSCGDCISVTGTVDTNGAVKDLAFTASGCALSVATASLLTEALIGKTPEEILALTAEDVEKLLETPISSGRKKCALLPLIAMQKIARIVQEKKLKK